MFAEDALRISLDSILLEHPTPVYDLEELYPTRASVDETLDHLLRSLHPEKDGPKKT